MKRNPFARALALKQYTNKAHANKAARAKRGYRKHKGKLNDGSHQL